MAKNSLTPLPPDYKDWLAELKSRIHGTRQQVLLSANQSQIRLYHEIGREILDRQDRQGWGAKVIEQLSIDLREAFPDMKGFSVRNLLLMRRFAQNCPGMQFVQRSAAQLSDAPIAQQSAAQLPWFHIVLLLTKISEPTEREWYARQAVQNGWTRITLELNIKNQLYRTVRDAEGNPVRAVVLLPDGKPAIDAEVGLGGLSTIAVRTRNDRIAGNTGNAVVRTDAKGEFEFPTPGVPYVVLAVHPDGFAFARQADVETGTIRMIPWARIEGIAYKNDKPALNSSLWGSFNMPDELILQFPRQQRYEAEVEVTTDAAGKFVLERVAPGLTGFMGFKNASADTRISTESGKTTTSEIKAKPEDKEE